MARDGYCSPVIYLHFVILSLATFCYAQQGHVDDLKTTTWVPILKYNKEQGVDGSYKTAFETGNHILAEETGYLKDANQANPNGVLVQEGTFTYEAPDGQIITSHYKADEHGFRVHGNHLPTPPPIPAEIQKGLDEIYAGIRLAEERRAQEAKTNPRFAEEQAERDRANFEGRYDPKLYS
ncbi:endocuticle structural glycoprotein SgAbd-4 [Culicoides brevitarsis]|uniref:endocuticle structural glycoprotein SgAbd-4 n=1 Tax=Culicoides brevitarsis TaxID=469753 RepID=UPI00307C7D13